MAKSALYNWTVQRSYYYVWEDKLSFSHSNRTLSINIFIFVRYSNCICSLYCCTVSRTTLASSILASVAEKCEHIQPFQFRRKRGLMLISFLPQ